MIWSYGPYNMDQMIWSKYFDTDILQLSKDEKIFTYLNEYSE